MNPKSAVSFHPQDKSSGSHSTLLIAEIEFDGKPEIKALPKAVQAKLDSFIFKEIPKVRFFKPTAQADVKR